jgi:hypothetical protein
MDVTTTAQAWIQCRNAFNVTHSSGSGSNPERGTSIDMGVRSQSWTGGYSLATRTDDVPDEAKVGMPTPFCSSGVVSNLPAPRPLFS